MDGALTLPQIEVRRSANMYGSIQRRQYRDGAERNEGQAILIDDRPNKLPLGSTVRSSAGAAGSYRGFKTTVGNRFFIAVNMLPVTH
jgi:hypothetical protein